MGQRTVDDEEEKHHEEHIGRETYTLSKRTRNQRWCDDGELHLEEGEQGQRNRGTAQDESPSFASSQKRGSNLAKEVMDAA